MKKATTLLLLIIIIISLCSCSQGNEQNESKDDSGHTHDYLYGYCQICGEISEEAEEDLHSFVEHSLSASVSLNYGIKGYDYEYEYTSVTTDEDKYYVEMTASFIYEGETYYTDLSGVYRWRTEIDDPDYFENNEYASKARFEKISGKISTPETRG